MNMKDKRLVSFFEGSNQRWIMKVIMIIAIFCQLGQTTTTVVTAFAASSPVALTTTTISRYHTLQTNNVRLQTKKTTTSTTQLHMFNSIPRGGATITNKFSNLATTVSESFTNWNSTPNNLFNVTLMSLAIIILMTKVLQRATSLEDAANRKAINDAKPIEIKQLQRKFLPVFWLLRCSDWLQGPYFYDVYASKMINGVQASMSLVSKLFLTGFASTAIFGPAVGRAADQYGRKKATLAFTIIYALGAISTKSTILQILFIGRILSGIGTSLLFSAPEAWLVAEAQNSKKDPNGQYLGETFGLAYAGDSIVAILAGQMAALAATQRGSTGPFELSSIVLLLGGALATILWNKENKAKLQMNETTSIREAIDVCKKDNKIMLVGAVQSLFEAAMYIFVLQWPPAFAGAIEKFFTNGSSNVIPTPFGTIFSCFMACCLLGSTLFGQFAKMAIKTEHFTLGFLSIATIAMSLATYTVKQTTMSLPILMASFFTFEACVGMYFPSIGSLRSKYVPDSHRSVIMNLFGIPLNVLVVTVFLSIHKLGVGGALSISSGALGLATICMYNLRRIMMNQNNIIDDPEPEFVI